MSKSVEYLERLATEALMGVQIAPRLWDQFMREMEYPLQCCRPDQLEEARKTWFYAYRAWLQQNEAKKVVEE